LAPPLWQLPHRPTGTIACLSKYGDYDYEKLDYQKSTTSILFLDTADVLLNVGPLVLFKKNYVVLIIYFDVVYFVIEYI